MNPLLSSLLASLCLTIPALAVLPEPPNVVFGSIVISNVPAGPDRTELQVEARQTPAGPAIAAYRMGDRPELGETYLLEIPVETAPAGNTSGIVGATLYLTLRDSSGDLAQVAYQIPERGHFQRTDFILTAPSDSNGLPDAWETAHFGAAGQNPSADPDKDGRSNLQEYLLGTDPNQADAFNLTVVNGNQQVWVSFFVRRAEGPGYAGKARYYSLEASTNAALGSWAPVANFTNILGDNRNILYINTETNPAMRLYRGKVELR